MTTPDPLAAALKDRYRLERRLGAGGMATVYLAHDLRFDRDIALKVLHADLVAALGAERFLREIRLTARLNHPNILTVLDSGEAAGQLFFAMPYIEGETLRERIARERRLPLADALRIAIEVGEALASAHREGVIHRDIKPENILLGQGHALVTDFGIAVTPESGDAQRLTGTGLLVGTPVYMSPEQASGETIDPRTDVYALGTVLFEMLTGAAPFAGATDQSALVRRLAEPAPDVSKLAPGVPHRTAAAIARALATRPQDRFATADEFTQALRPDFAEVEGQRWDPDHAPSSRTRRWWVGAALVPMVAALLFARRQSPAAAHALTQITTSPTLELWPAWSPDGKSIVFAAERNGFKKLMLRTLATGDERQVTTGAGDDIMPVFAPEGDRIAFVRANRPGGHIEEGDLYGVYLGGDIFVLTLSTTQVRQVVHDAMSPAFSPDGRRLAFDAQFGTARRIWTADALGTNPAQVTDDSSEAVSHVSPSWSPDGKHIAYRRFRTVTLSDIAVVDLATHRSAMITDDLVTDVFPAWSPTGDWIYFSSTRGGGLNIWRSPVGAGGKARGAAEQMTSGPGNDVHASVSRDGQRVAFAILGINSDIWRLPVAPATGKPTGPPEPVIATTREDSRGAWSPDNRTIAFNSDRAGSMTLWLHDVVSGRDSALTAPPGSDYQANWAPDGKTIAFFSARGGSNDIWTLALGSDKMMRLTDSASAETNPFFSPDGVWIAYHSDRTGRNEMWLMRADGRDQRQVTTIGVSGHFMRWADDGRAVYVRSPSSPLLLRVSLPDGAAAPVDRVTIGAHMSISPDRRNVLDVDGHTTLFVHPIDGRPKEKVFQFTDPDLRIDYPVWSPDGRWILFDRAAPHGGDIWMLSGLR